MPVGSGSSSLPWWVVRCAFRLSKLLPAGLHRDRIKILGLLTYVWDSTAQDAEAVHDTVRTARSEIVAWVCFADVGCHGTGEVCIVRVGRSEVEVVDSRGVCGEVFVVELGLELHRAAYTVSQVSCDAQSVDGRSA